MKYLQNLLISALLLAATACIGLAQVTTGGGLVPPSGAGVQLVADFPGTCIAPSSYQLSVSPFTIGDCVNGTVVSRGGGGGSGANPTATIGLTAVNGSAGTFLRSDGAPALSQAITPTWTGTHTFQPAARSSGVASYFRVIAPADTTQAASTESIGAQFGGNTSAATVTRQWATGALTTQRENVFVAPTYAFAGASTLTTAATVAISGAPVAGTNATISLPLALYVQSGDAWFSNKLRIAQASGTSAQGLLFNNGATELGGLQGVELSGATYVFFNSNRAFNGTSNAALGYSARAGAQLILKDSELIFNQYAGGSTTDTERWRVDTSGLLGINKSSSIAAQLHVVSSSASRVGLRVDSAATPSADIAQFTVNNSTTAGAYTGVAKGGTVFTPQASYTGAVGTTTLNLTNGNSQVFTFGAGNETIALSNIPQNAVISLSVIQDATGSRTITWPAAIKWSGGTAPTLSTAAAARDEFLFMCNGTNCYVKSVVLDVR